MRLTHRILFEFKYFLYETVAIIDFLLIFLFLVDVDDKKKCIHGY